MTQLSRRLFLAGGLGSLACTAAEVWPFQQPDLGRSIEELPFQPTTLFLTWAHDPTTTMVVQWVGVRGETSDTNIYYRPRTPTPAVAESFLTGAVPLAMNSWAKQPTTTRLYPFTDFKIFRAELTGLRPGTDYEFRIGKASPTYRFRTMPAKATDTIHFISGGDVGVNHHALANNMQAARQEPMFAVIGGDLGYDNGRSVEISLAFLRNYSRTMVTRDGRLIPMIVCIGNHEVDGGYNKERKHAPFFYALFDGLFPETGYNVLDFGDYLSLVLLDTGHTTPVGGAQTAWLEKVLAERRDHPHTLVVNHVPAYPSARSATGSLGKLGTGEENRKFWVPLFEKYRVPVVLEHHDHTFKRTKPLLNGTAHGNGVLYLGDGSWGRLRSLQKPEKLGIMAAVSMTYHLSLHRLQGEERFHLAMDENGRVMDVARSGQRLCGVARTSD